MHQIESLSDGFASAKELFLPAAFNYERMWLAHHVALNEFPTSADPTYANAPNRAPELRICQRRSARQPHRL
jgi:hypothetical protein